MSHDPHQHCELSDGDRRVLDALVECGFEPEAIEAPAPEDRRRAEAMTGLLELLEDYPVEDADDTLVHATLARIGRLEDERAARMNFAAAAEAREPRRRRFRVPDFLSIAAVILIGASVVWPTATYLRRNAIDAGCANNMRRLALGFGQYAGDYDNALPLARAGLMSHWTATDHNVINLRPLTRNGYCSLGDFECPGHDDSHYGPSYSYQWQAAGHRARWGVGRITLVLGDRNPLIDAARAGRVLPPLTLSINHGGRGQNVLASDGATVWLERPVIGNGDNIWLPGPVDALRPGVRYAPAAGDAFLAH